MEEKKLNNEKATPKKASNNKQNRSSNASKKRNYNKKNETTGKKNNSVRTNSKAKKKTNLNENVKKIETKTIDINEKETTTDQKLDKTIVFDDINNLSAVVENLEENKVILEDKIIKRSKAKKIVIILLIILIIAIILFTIKYVADNGFEKNKALLETVNSNVYNKVSNKYKKESEIKDSSNDTIIKEIDYDNIETISLSDFEKINLKKEDMIAFVSSTSCYGCIVFEPIIEEVFKELDKKIYRIDISNMDEEERNEFRAYYAFKYTPTIFIIKDGIVTDEVAGAMSKEDLKNWLKDRI